MTPVELNQSVLTPALALLPPRMDTPEARVLLTAIGLQESALEFRKQVGGPAHGLWQFESEGVTGVLQHSPELAAAAVRSRGCEPTTDAVYAAIVTDDILAAIIARLLLWSDPAPLPALGAVDAAWKFYIWNWRPGRPHVAAWADNYTKAQTILS